MLLTNGRHGAGCGGDVARFRVIVHVLAVADLPPTGAAASVAVSLFRRGWVRPLVTSFVTPTSARRAVVRQSLRIEAIKLSLNPSQATAGSAGSGSGKGRSGGRSDSACSSDQEDCSRGLAQSKRVSVGLVVDGVNVAQGLLDVGACVTALPSSPSATPDVVVVPLSNGSAVSVRVATCQLPPRRRFAAWEEPTQEPATKDSGGDATSPLSVQYHPTCPPLVEVWDEGDEADCLSECSSSSAGVSAEFDSLILADDGTAAMVADVADVAPPLSAGSVATTTSRAAFTHSPRPLDTLLTDALSKARAAAAPSGEESPLRMNTCTPLDLEAVGSIESFDASGDVRSDVAAASGDGGGGAMDAASGGGPLRKRGCLWYGRPRQELAPPPPAPGTPAAMYLRVLYSQSIDKNSDAWDTALDRLSAAEEAGSLTGMEEEENELGFVDDDGGGDGVGPDEEYPMGSDDDGEEEDDAFGDDIELDEDIGLEGDDFCLGAPSCDGGRAVKVDMALVRALISGVRPRWRDVPPVLKSLVWEISRLERELKVARTTGEVSASGSGTAPSVVTDADAAADAAALASEHDAAMAASAAEAARLRQMLATEAARSSATLVAVTAELAAAKDQVAAATAAATAAASSAAGSTGSGGATGADAPPTPTEAAAMCEAATLRAANATLRDEVALLQSENTKFQQMIVSLNVEAFRAPDYADLVNELKTAKMDLALSRADAEMLAADVARLRGGRSGGSGSGLRRKSSARIKVPATKDGRR
ncbi:hypothetical protein MMPV_003082 [Pyropia vietnamensis]